MQPSRTEPCPPDEDTRSEVMAPETLHCDHRGFPHEHVRRVLIVDDHVAIAENMARVLRRHNHQVRTAGDGLTAFEESQTFLPHIVFSDLDLPKMSGFTLASRLRELPALQDTVLVAVTGFEDSATLETVRQTFDHYLVKPPNLETIEALIRDTVSGADQD